MNNFGGFCIRNRVQISIWCLQLKRFYGIWRVSVKWWLWWPKMYVLHDNDSILICIYNFKYFYFWPPPPSPSPKLNHLHLCFIRNNKHTCTANEICIIVLFSTQSNYVLEVVYFAVLNLILLCANTLYLANKIIIKYKYIIYIQNHSYF